MGGGKRRFPEVRKARRLAPPRLANEDQVQGDSSSQSQPTPETDGLRDSVCERAQLVAFRLFDEADVTVAEAVRVTFGQPPIVVSENGRIGELSDLRQAQTLSACISSGYSILGEVTAVDLDLREGLASVAGLRAQE